MEDLIPNYTLFIQMGLFFASYLVLNQLVFKPYVKLIHAREALTVGLKQKAAEDKDAAQKFRTQYEAFVKEERKTLSAEIDQKRVQIAEHERTQLLAAREVAAKELSKSRETLKKDMEEARRALSSQVAEYSSQIVSKLVGKTVKVSVPIKSAKATQTEQTV